MVKEVNMLAFERLLVYPKPPYDFDLSCVVFGFEKPMPEIYEEGVWRRVLRLGSGRLIPVALRSLGTVEEPKIEVKCSSTVSEQEKSELATKLDWMFSFSEDLTALYAFMSMDPILRNVKERLYGLKAGSMGATVFESIVKAILQQQISLRVSFWITNSLVTRFGEHVKVNGLVYYDFPTPSTLAKASLEKIRRCGLSWRKTEYIKGIAEKVANNEFDPEGLKKLSNEEAMDKLKGFRGVGTWTAELVLCTGLRRNDVIPADDLGVRRTVSRFYSDGRNVSGDEVRELTEKWGAFKRDIVFYLICVGRS